MRAELKAHLMAMIKKKSPPHPETPPTPTYAGIMTREELKSFSLFAVERRAPSEPWSETYRGVQFSTWLPDDGPPLLTPAPEFVDTTSVERSPEEVAASESTRERQRIADQELRLRDALSLPHETGVAVLSIPVARATDITAAIVYRYLQAEQSQVIGHNAHFADWRYWTYESAQRIKEYSLPFFESRQVVEAAMTRLEKRGLLVTESTGKFLSTKLRTDQKRDLKTWCHVHRPIDHAEPTLSFDVVTAKLQGVSEAILIGYLESMPATAESCTDKNGQRFFRIVATALETVLPIGEKTIRRILVTLQERGVIGSHPDQPSFLRVLNRTAVKGMEPEKVAKFREWKEWYENYGPGKTIAQWKRWQS